MNEVTPGLVDELKERLHISHSSEDGNLERLLSSSIAYVNSKCGEVDVYGNSITDTLARELVIERVRYAYNDSLEFFEDNFLSQIQGLSLALMPGVVEEGEVT